MKTRLISPLSANECQEKLKLNIHEIKNFSWDKAPNIRYTYYPNMPPMVIGNVDVLGISAMQVRSAFSARLSPVLECTFKEFSRGTKVDCEFRYFRVAENLTILLVTLGFLAIPAFLIVAGILGQIEHWPFIIFGSSICLFMLYFYRPIYR